MSKLKALRGKHRQEIDDLRKTCTHPKGGITIRHDTSSIGAGTLYGSVVVTCTNCGKKKIIFELDAQQRQKVKKQLSRQGFKDERLDLYAEYGWELNV